MADAAALVDAIVRPRRDERDRASNDGRQPKSGWRHEPTPISPSPSDWRRSSAATSTAPHSCAADLSAPPRSAGDRRPGCARCAASSRQIDAERRQLFDDVGSAAPIGSHALGDAEASVRQLAERCRDKIVQRSRRWPSRRSPRSATCQSVDELQAMPWPAARAAMSPVDRQGRSDWRRRWPRPVVGSSNPSTIATICAACCSRSATRPTPTGSARTPTSNRCTASAESCCGRRRAISPRHARSSTATLPRSTPRSRRACHRGGVGS